MRHLALALAFLALSAGGALAQAQGTYPATLFCEGSSGSAPLRESLTVEIESGRAVYSVKSRSANETGRGSLEGRRLVLTGSGRVSGTAFTSRYAGEVSGRGGTLTGSQVGGGKTRACQFVLGDGRS